MKGLLKYIIGGAVIMFALASMKGQMQNQNTSNKITPNTFEVQKLYKFTTYETKARDI